MPAWVHDPNDVSANLTPATKLGVACSKGGDGALQVPCGGFDTLRLHQFKCVDGVMAAYRIPNPMI